MITIPTLNQKKIKSRRVIAKSMELEAVKSIAAVIAIAAGSFSPALAIGKIGSKALDSIGRNPECASKIQAPMIIGIAFAEAVAIYALVIALIVKFV